MFPDILFGNDFVYCRYGLVLLETCFFSDVVDLARKLDPEERGVDVLFDVVFVAFETLLSVDTSRLCWTTGTAAKLL